MKVRNIYLWLRPVRFLFLRGHDLVSMQLTWIKGYGTLRIVDKNKIISTYYKKNGIWRTKYRRANKREVHTIKRCISLLHELGKKEKDSYLWIRP